MLTTFALLVPAAVGTAQETNPGLPMAKAADVGFSAERLGRVTEMLRAN